MVKIEIKCQNCGKSFKGYQYEIDKRKFCSQSCSSSMKRDRAIKSTCISCSNEFTALYNNKKFCSKPCKQRYYRAQSKVIDNSLSTIKKNSKNKTCEICGWKETSCDVHHIVEQCNGGTNEKTNLIVLCPNHHRMVHRNLVSLEQLNKIVKERECV